MTYFETITGGWSKEQIQEMLKLQELRALLRAIPVSELARWWSAFSEQCSAVWLIVDRSRAEQFEDWLLEERN